MARPYLAAVGAVGLVFVAHSYAWAQAQVQDIARSPEPGKSERLKKLEGSTVEVSSYIGSGTFYVSGFHNSYASLAVFVRPSYSLGTRYKLALRARLYAEEEFTTPDTPNGRRFYPYDPWIWLAADNIKTFERSKIRIGGTFRTIYPLSYESRYENLVFGVGAGPNVNREFTFGQVNDEARKWTLKLTWAGIFAKYVQTSHFRGTGPGDTTGCMAPAGGGAVSSGPSGSEADRCGGPANTNFAIGNTFLAMLARGKWSGMLSLYIANSFKYAFPNDMLTPENAVLTGRSDTTWGIASLSYEVRPHISLNAGVASLQPALDSRYRYPRFPWWDLSSGSYNNYSQVFFSVSGNL